MPRLVGPTVGEYDGCGPPSVLEVGTGNSELTGTPRFVGSGLWQRVTMAVTTTASRANSPQVESPLLDVELVIRTL
ncbi:hypothetical protein ABZV93_06235 [Actinopolymorpha sp. NPDC004070]|uniref:hypothetical protein n=1 Tax=Actinopolymorpha sp. NPDC004070 TaxID=3154548 RepID=UPI0033AE624B